MPEENSVQGGAYDVLAALDSRELDVRLLVHTAKMCQSGTYEYTVVGVVAHVAPRW